MKNLWKIFIVLLVNILVVTMLMCGLPNIKQNNHKFKSTAYALSKQGSCGEEVRNIQSKLKDRGLYAGNIDGIFGKQTKNAVLEFQRQNGLVADGIAGPNTLNALGIVSNIGVGTYGSDDEALLAKVISAESRGEPYNGQVAVGAVILNRIEHPSFPNSLAGVVYEPGAFSCMTDGQINEEVTDSARQAARDALNGIDPTGGAIYYYNPDKATNAWIRSRPVISTIGDHLFCI